MSRRNLYVIELSREVMRDRKFAEKNPECRPDKPCVYVGMTSLEPEKRFENHKLGYKACRYVKKYGVRLRPRLYKNFSNLAYEIAVVKERQLATKLRARGYAVCQN